MPATATSARSPSPLHAPDASAALPKIEGHEPVDAEALRKLLYARDYSELEKRLQEFQDRAIAEPAVHEFDLFAAYAPFEDPSLAVHSKLDAWVRQRPQSHLAYSARALCRQKLGWEARGHEFRDKTSDRQFADMQEYFQLAAEDATQALRLDPLDENAHRVLIQMAPATSMATVRGALDNALKMLPASYSLRASAIHGLQPRWGGSYEEISEVARQAQQHAAKNPRLKMLLGYPLWAVAEDQSTDAHNAAALKLADEAITKALEFGPADDFLNLASWIQLKTRKFAEAVATAKKIEAMYPQQNQSKVKGLLDDITGDAADLYRDEDYGPAAAAYGVLAAEQPDNADMHYWMAVCLLNLKRADEALPGFERAIQLDPSRYDAYWRLDWILSNKGQFAQILPYWTAYIALHPEDSRAYLERGGAYHHLGRHKEAYADLTKACQLGDDNACKRMPTVPRE